MSLAIISLPACVRLSASALIVVPGTQRIPVSLLAGPTLGSLTPFSSQLITHPSIQEHPLMLAFLCQGPRDDPWSTLSYRAKRMRALSKNYEGVKQCPL